MGARAERVARPVEGYELKVGSWAVATVLDILPEGDVIVKLVSTYDNHDVVLRMGKFEWMRFHDLAQFKSKFVPLKPPMKAE